MTTITIEECKDTYVTSCTPPPTVDFPNDCEYGVEIGNNTAVCAAAPPADLAVTGPDMNDVGGMVIIGAVLVVGGLAAVIAVRLRRHKGDAE
ncbi:membrane protein [Microbacterium phage Huwbert]|nr:membrane protein [Microbacterium phage Huwbert]